MKRTPAQEEIASALGIKKPPIAIKEQLYKIRNEYNRDFGVEPEAFLLGPEEYVEFLKNNIALQSYSSKPIALTFCSISVRAKMTPGVDIMTSGDIALRLAK